MGRVLVDDDGSVRVVTLSNPTKRNALDRAMLGALAAAMPAPGARAVIVRGDPAGAAFSSGFDIGTIDAAERERGLDPIDEAARAVEACPVPVIAALDGACMGGALEIAMACTLRVASSTAKLAMPPAKLGLVYSATGLARFLRAVSVSRAQWLFLSGERVEPARALAWGLVDAVVDADDVADGAAVAEAARLAALVAQNAPLAVSGMLDALRRLAKPGGPDDADLKEIGEAHERTVASEDLAEGVRAFAEKRAPKFSGR